MPRYEIHADVTCSVILSLEADNASAARMAVESCLCMTAGLVDADDADVAVEEDTITELSITRTFKVEDE